MVLLSPFQFFLIGVATAFVPTMSSRATSAGAFFTGKTFGNELGREVRNGNAKHAEDQHWQHRSSDPANPPWR